MHRRPSIFTSHCVVVVAGYTVDKKLGPAAAALRCRDTHRVVAAR